MNRKVGEERDSEVLAWRTGKDDERVGNGQHSPCLMIAPLLWAGKSCTSSLTAGEVADASSGLLMAGLVTLQ